MLNDRELTIIEGVLNEIIYDPDAWKTWGTMTVKEATVNTMRHEMTPYCRRKYPPHYTPWQSLDGKHDIFVVLYHY